MLMRDVMTYVAVLVLASPVFGHHSDAALDMNALVTIEGTVTEFSMRNPHAYFTVRTADERGRPVEWTVQMASAITLSRRGWTRDSLAVGDRVTVSLRPARDGRPYGLMASVEKNGDTLGTNLISDSRRDRSAASPVAVRATSPAGKWLVDRSSLGDDYPGGLDQLMRRELRLTEKGRTAEAAYSQASAENPELDCITKPTPAMIIYTDLYPIEITFNERDETATIRSQYFDQQRTVYMDGRAHPDASVLTHEGHSIGRWEGNVLVIDTRNFAYHRSPYQNGTPSGPEKHVVERYRLDQGGTRMDVEFTLEDPEYIVGSMTHTRQLIYSPETDMSPFNCDLESTRRFLP